MQSVLFRASSV